MQLAPYLGWLLRQSSVMVGLRCDGVQREVELVPPATRYVTCRSAPSRSARKMAQTNYLLMACQGCLRPEERCRLQLLDVHRRNCATRPASPSSSHARDNASPAELESRPAQLVVAHLRHGVALGQVGRMGGDLVGDDPRLHVVPVWQAQVLPGGHVAQQGGACSPCPGLVSWAAGPGQAGSRLLPPCVSLWFLKMQCTAKCTNQAPLQSRVFATARPGCSPAAPMVAAPMAEVMWS
jgi:hypothetical protein